MVIGMVPMNAFATESDTTIDLAQGSYTIETEGNYVVQAYTGANTLTIKADATVELQGVNITAAADTSAISIESGNVTLNVTDDSTLTGGKGGAGIYVAEDASVTVKGGKLTAIGNGGEDTSDSGAAGIGGTYANGNSGAITIDGATVVAEGYGVHGSGIGSGSGKVVGEIKIVSGANVTAQGGYYADGAGTKLQSSYGKSDPEGGAAIGGGGKTASTIADITISDSIVTAYGGSKAAGIGANFWSSVSEIVINGASNVTAQGGSSSAGIGTSRAGDNGVSAKISIADGVVNATGGAYGAGIGAGYNADSLGNGADASALPETSIAISGGIVTANGGEGGAGIGGGYKSDNVNIDITGGNVTARAGEFVSGKTIDNGGEACAIGSGANGSGKFENSPAVEISGGATVTATTEYGGKPAIEGWVDEEADAEDNITVTVLNAPVVLTPVAKVGNTEYTSIDEAIANWTKGTTLTLLANVTLSDVIKINTADNLTLDLGIYTMTAASGKNVIEITAIGTGDSEHTTITVKADATNPGGINAGSKSIIYYDYSKGTTSANDRPIIKITGGVFTGSTSSLLTAGIYAKGTAARKCATINISGGTFNCSILGTGKSKMLISGGTFNYSVGSQGDSTCYRLISGGTFKSFGFMTADAANKFGVGSALSNYDKGVYVDDDGYLVVGGPVITEAGTDYEASTDYSRWNSYLQYSSAKDNGLYWTSAEAAIAKQTTGTVNVYVNELDMTGSKFKGTINIEDTLTVTFTEGTTPAWTVATNVEGMVVTYTDSVADGVVTRTYVVDIPRVYVAQIGETKYESLSEAVAAANAIEGGATVTLLANVTLGEKLTITGNVTIEGEYTITRDDTYTGTLFAVNAGATLTLDGGLTIDGANEWTMDMEAYEADLKAFTKVDNGTKYFTPEEGAPVADAHMITVSGEGATLNLNKVTIKNHYANGEKVIVSAGTGATVNLTGATITHNAITAGSGLVVNASSGKWDTTPVIWVNMNEGTVIDGNHVGGNHGVFKIYMGTVFTMDGGSIKNTTGWNSNGVAVGVYWATFNMNGGEICSNSSVYGPNNGRNAPVYLHSASIYTMTGGSICHNVGGSRSGLDAPYADSTSNGVATITGGYIGENSSYYSDNGYEGYNPDVTAGDKLTISGGTFTQDVTEWLAPNTGLIYDEANGVYTITKDLYEYNGTAYNTLAEAIAAIKANGMATASTEAPVVKVLLSHKVNGPIVVDIDLTLDLNGKTITTAATEAGTYVDAFTILADVTVTGEGTVDARPSNGYTFYVGDTSNNAGNLTIENGNFYGETSVVNNRLGTVNINGGYFEVDLENEGDTYAYVLNCIDANYENGSAKIVVKGGTFSKFNPADNEAENPKANFVAEGYVSETKDEGATYTVRAMNYVAQVGETKYESLQEAYDNANGGQIVLLRDVELTETLLIDKGGAYFKFNSYKVSGDLDVLIKILNNSGTVSISTNSSIENTGDVFWIEADKNVNLYGPGTIVSENGNCIYLRSGSIMIQKAELIAYGQYPAIQGNGNYAGSVTLAEMDGVVPKVSAPNSDMAIYWPQNGTLTIKGGTITGKTAVYVKSGTVKISGGEFIATGENVAYVPNNNGAYATGDALVIESSANPAYETPVVEITGGTFKSENAKPIAVYGEGASVEKFVSGGLFNKELDSELIAEGFASVANGDGMWSVTNYILWIKAELLAGHDVKLDRDIVVDGSYIESIPAPTNGNGKYPNYGIFNVVGDYDVTFDLSGHTITYNGHADFQWNGKTYSSCTVAHGIFYANDGADLTVIDSSAEKTGTVMVYGLASGAYVASNDTTFTIEGGTWKNEGCATCGGTNIFLYPLQGGELYIKGGHFEQALDSDGESYLIVEHGGAYANTVIDYSKTKVEISGGTFVGMNPAEIKYFQQTADNKLDMASQPTTNGCAEGFVSVDNGDGTYTVKLGTYVAQIGETKYFSLQAAINAAEDGAVITVIADHELTWDGETYVDGLPVFVAVNNKTVTIDLNGKKLTGNSGTKDNAFYAAFAVDNDGSLTLKDSMDGGLVEITGECTMYSLLMAYENGANKKTKLIVESGSYYLENAHDSLIFSGDNSSSELAYINGGNFTLGNVGVGENGKPWIVNVVGAGDNHVTISGGTYNADINRQHWSNEVLVPETYYTVENGDGTWTVKDGAVAYVYEGLLTGPYFAPKNIGYATLEEALNASAAKNDENVTLLKDAEVYGNAVVAEVTSLHLNGYSVVLADVNATLTAEEGLNVTTNVDGYEVDYENGVYKLVVERVAMNLDTGVKYYDIDLALWEAQAGQTVMLLRDCTSADRVTYINGGTKLDLNGKLLTVQNIMAFGDIIDGEAGGNGGLVVSNDTSKARVMLLENNEFLPMYDAENGCYRFFQFELQTKGSKATTDGVKFGFSIMFKNIEAYKLLEKTDTNGVKLTIDVTWDGMPSNKLVLFTFSDSTVQEFAKAAYNDLIKAETTSKAMTVNVTGLDALEQDGGSITVAPYLASEKTGVKYVGEKCTYTVS